MIKQINQRQIFPNDTHSTPSGTGTGTEMMLLFSRYQWTGELEMRPGQVNTANLAILTKIQLFFWNTYCLIAANINLVSRFLKKLILTVFARFLVTYMEDRLMEVVPHPAIFTKISIHPFFKIFYIQKITQAIQLFLQKPPFPVFITTSLTLKSSFIILVKSTKSYVGVWIPSHHFLNVWSGALIKTSYASGLPFAKWDNKKTSCHED